MSVRTITRVLVAALIGYTSAAAQTAVQSVDDKLSDGSSYLFLEAESAIELGGGDPLEAETGFILVDKDNPIQTITEDANGLEVINGGLDVLPADTNASGGAAVFHQFGSGASAKWNVQFATADTYYLYMRYSFFNRDSNTDYGNEDSIYVPPAFNSNTRSDWIGFEGVDGDPFDPFEKIGDSNRDGWMPLGKDVVSAGEIETHNNVEEDFWNGQFHWGFMGVAVDMDANDNFVGGAGHGIRYEVDDADLGTVLDFEITGRENYGVFDAFVFSTSNMLLEDFTQEQMDEFFLNPGGVSIPGDVDGDGDVDADDIDSLSMAISGGLTGDNYDVDGNGTVDASDRQALIGSTLNTFLGDSNLDGEFNSSDFVAVFTVGEYEDEIIGNSGWADGDWDGDADFDSSDFVAAFSQAAYEMGPKAPAVSPVPEPRGLGLIAIASLWIAVRRR